MLERIAQGSERTMTNLSLPSPSDENRGKKNRVRLPLVVIAIGLVMWGGFLALGAYLGLSDQVPSHDPRRAWVMLISSGGFLLFWLLALVWRGRRLRRTGPSQPEQGQSNDR